MPEFSILRSGGLQVSLEDYEADVLRNLANEMSALLRDTPHANPALTRLFPDAYAQEDDARAYRELVGDDLKEHKLRGVAMLRSKLGIGGDATIELDDEDLEMWLAVLTDMRLAIGARLNVTEENMSEEIDPGAEEAPAMSILHWLGWLQEATLRQIQNGGE
jgi:hypothetical protein